MRALLLLALVLVSGPARAVVLDDGQTHVIDAQNSFPIEDVRVFDGPGSSTTTVSIVPGGEIGTGIGGDLQLFESSTVVMSGGTIGRNLGASGANSVQVWGGTVIGQLLIGGTSSLELDGGTVNELRVSGVATASVMAGTIWNGVDVEDQGFARLLGGSFSTRVDSVISNGEGAIEILGGSFSSTQFLALDNSSITVRGTGFNFPPGPIAASSGLLTGILADGTPLSMNFGRASTAEIALAFLTPAEDIDADAVIDLLDNCPEQHNPDQADTDLDGVGDACNDAADFDGDEWSDVLDNCPNNPNPLQTDADGDLIGDLCDPFPNDPDNEQAQCEQDFGICVIDRDQCDTDLIVTSADLGICEADLETTSSNLTMCEADLNTLMLILEPEVLLETATRGGPGDPGSTFPVAEGIFVGARFEVTAQVPVGSVGAHLTETGTGVSGEVFAAIVALDGPADYPDSFDFSTTDFVAATRLELPTLSNDVLMPLPLTLAPGWYALVLGSGVFGAQGEGGVSLHNELVEPSTLFSGFADSVGWQEASFPARLLVSRKSPELLTCEDDLASCQAVVIEGNGDVNGDGVFDLTDTVIGRRVLAGEPVQ